MPRRIITASENQTVRKTAEQTIDLMAVGLFHAVAIIIQDKRGNASITHVSHSTDLAFIQREAQLMQGQYTLDIIQANPSRGKACPSDLSLAICNHLDMQHMDNIPATKNNRVHYVKYNSVLLRDEKLFQPKMDDFIEYFMHSLPNSAPIPALNAFKLDLLETCGYNPTQNQSDIYIAQLNGLFSTSLPKITHDATGWHRTPTLISQQTKIFMEEHTTDSILNLVNHDSLRLFRIDSRREITCDPFKNIRKSLNYILPGLKANLAQQKNVAEILEYDANHCPWIQEASYFTPVTAHAQTIASEDGAIMASAYRI
ncbi:MAG: hypothetical protein P1U36_00125 [Legionellaceae bacterium]|nr:hypothetical protein [Legionellaceae bacterium]